MEVASEPLAWEGPGDHPLRMTKNPQPWLPLPTERTTVLEVSKSSVPRWLQCWWAAIRSRPVDLQDRKNTYIPKMDKCGLRRKAYPRSHVCNPDEVLKLRHNDADCNDGLRVCLCAPFREQAIPVNSPKNLVARAAQVLRHPICPCLLPPTHDHSPRRHDSQTSAHAFFSVQLLGTTSLPRS